MPESPQLGHNVTGAVGPNSVNGMGPPSPSTFLGAAPAFSEQAVKWLLDVTGEELRDVDGVTLGGDAA